VFLVKNYNEKEGKVQETAIAPVSIPETGIVERAKRMWSEYEELLRTLKREGDFVKVPFKVKKRNEKGEVIGEETIWKEVPTKQWASKLIRFFGLSVRTSVRLLAGDVFLAKARVGRGEQWVEDFATSSLEEAKNSPLLKRGMSQHHLAVAIATTKAINRAVFRLLAAGAVSAEEIQSDIAVGEEIEPEPIQPKPIQPTPQPRPQPQSRWNNTEPSEKDKEKAQLYAEKYRLMEQINQLVGDEKADQLAQTMFKVRRLVDLGVPQLREILSSLSAEQEEEIELPPREERLL
jgi:hypothetical protein